MNSDQTDILPPRDVHHLQALIASRHVVASDASRLVLQAAFEHPELIAYGNAKSIAERCGVAPSTVWRISSLLGFASFREFKQLFQHHLVKRASSARKR